MSKQPWCAAFLSSLLPGAGQIYAGAPRRGIVILTLFLVFMISGIMNAVRFISSDSAAGATRHLLTMFISLGLYVIIAFWSLFDAYVTTKQLNNLDGSLPIKKPAKNPWLAVFLSNVVPGIGQFYNGQANILKGIGFLAVFFLIDSLVDDVHAGFHLLFIPFTLIILKDAFESAERRNGSNRRFFVQGTAVARIFVLTMVISSGIPIGAIIRSTALEAFRIPASSMMPTLLIGDHILTKKNFDRNSLQRGDIIVFKYPRDRSKNFIKRVIAVGGETIEGKGGVVSVNNVPLEEPYTMHLHEMSYSGSFGPIQIPMNSYYVLGDNRDNSMDSRIWGPVPAEDVIATALKIYWSWDAAEHSVRWSRIGIQIK